MRSLWKRVSRAVQLAQRFGLSWLLFRIGYGLRLRLGVLQRVLPATSWDAQPFSGFLTDPDLAEQEKYFTYRKNQAPLFFFTPDDRLRYAPLLTKWDDERNNPILSAEKLALGELLYFSHHVVCGELPPDWHKNASTGQSAPVDLHWSRIGDFECGDIKYIWEPSRFAFTYDLVRAYWRDGEERHAELFWQLVEDWRKNNPPQQGVNWKCGQEIGLRVMAWCFGLYGFLKSSTSTPQRLVMLAQMIAVSGARIAGNLSYALSQRNNHGISEGAGLWTIGTLFPELREAKEWRERGREVLEKQGRDLIYNDGAFSQHSMNYHRLMLHDYLWCLRLADLQECPFSDELKARVKKSGEFLFQIQDEKTGRVPLYGANDGALILPLSNCGYHDFRPVVQSVHYLSHGKCCFRPGPWDEEALWMFGTEVLDARLDIPGREDLRAEIGGYYTLRAENGFTFTRCASFRDRPSQADMMHVDVWWKGCNIALDSGTNSYNAPPPWNDPFAHTAYHNIVTVDGLDQMERIGKFLWMPWMRGHKRSAEHSVSGHLAYWEGEHNGYQRLQFSTTHRRAILRLGAEHWLILDELKSAARHRYRLHWLLCDVPYKWDETRGHIALQTSAGAYHVQAAAVRSDNTYSLVRADENTPRGWRAPNYGSREAALSYEVIVDSDNARFWTILGPSECRIATENDKLLIQADDWQAQVAMRTEAVAPMVRAVNLTGDLTDTLAIP